jgi:hypothetical protein
MKFIVSLLLAGLCESSLAAGPWDGIYQTGPTDYLSIHQNGNTVIVGQFSTFSSLGLNVDIGDGQRFFPQRADVWNLLSGELNGSSATLTGEVSYGACLANYTITFQPGAAFIARNYFSNTQAGAAQGIDCAALFQLLRSYGYGIDAVKVF